MLNLFQYLVKPPPSPKVEDI